MTDAAWSSLNPGSELQPIADAMMAALVDLAAEVGGRSAGGRQVGLNARSAILGRVFSVPGSVSSRATSDVLIVHTTD